MKCWVCVHNTNEILKIKVIQSHGMANTWEIYIKIKLERKKYYNRQDTSFHCMYPCYMDIGIAIIYSVLCSQFCIYFIYVYIYIYVCMYLLISDYCSSKQQNICAKWIERIRVVWYGMTTLKTIIFMSMEIKCCRNNWTLKYVRQSSPVL